MKKIIGTILSFFLILLGTSLLHATTISTSVGDWNGYAYTGSTPSLLNSAYGLQVQANSNRANISAFSSPTMDFTNSTIDMKWMVDGNGSYSAFSIGIGEWTTSHNAFAYNSFTSNGNYSSLYRLTDSTYYRTIIEIRPDFSYTVNTYDFSTNALLNTLSRSISVQNQSNLSSASLWLGVNDNSNNNASIFLSEATATSNSPVPEPATMLLFCVGLIGLAGVSRRKK